MRFKEYEKVVTLVSKKGVPAGAKGIIVAVLDGPEEWYDLEFPELEPAWGYKSYSPEEIKREEWVSLDEIHNG